VSNFTIQNACNVPLNAQTGTLPYLQETLYDWLQPMVFVVVSKYTSSFQLIEKTTNINFMGIAQPLQGRQLNLFPEGQRKWNYIQIHAQCDTSGALITLKPDDVINYLNIQYRIMTARNFSVFGYIEFILVENYTNSGLGLLQGDVQQVAP
jgi:hypothetical protein